MSTITFDTLQATQKLKAAGYNEQQAEAVIRVLADAHENLITREHFDAKFAVMEVKIDKLAWMLGIVIALAIANFAKQFF